MRYQQVGLLSVLALPAFASAHVGQHSSMTLAEQLAHASVQPAALVLAGAIVAGLLWFRSIRARRNASRIRSRDEVHRPEHRR
ncbi:MAG: hypothetical protein RQ736_11710 [Thiogranum sp.]|nr:hypothetical protein [Thiogranum sp.]